MKVARIIPLLSCVALASCIQGSVSDQLSVDEQVKVPGTSGAGALLLQAGVVQLPPQSYTFDVSGAVSNLSKVGRLTLGVQHSALTGGGLNAITSVIVDMQQADQSEPSFEVSNVSVTNTGSSIDLTVENVDAVVRCLSAGKTTLTVVLTVDAAMLPANAVMLDYDLELDVSIDVKKP